MSTVAELREGLAVRLRTINGLASTATAPANAQPPFAYVLPGTPFIEWDESFNRGLDKYNFTVRIIVGAVDQQGSQLLLDAYLNPDGTSSVKAALNADRTLGGKAFDLRASTVSAYGVFMENEAHYLGCEIAVVVYA